SSPVVRRIAAEHSIDITRIEGSGVGGRVTKQDLLAHLAGAAANPGIEVEQVATPAASPTVAPSAPFPTAPRTVILPPAPAPLLPSARVEPEAPAARMPVELFPGDEVVPLTPMRRAIAEHMVRSERTAPHATVVMEVDMTGVAAARAGRKEEFRRREGIELSYLPFAIKAATLALRDHPCLNAVWDEERIVHRAAINVGVAVALEDGLVVPVVRHADRLSIAGLAHAVAELAAKARAGTLAPDDLAGGTFTVNNPGTFGSIASTPILVQPQVAILSTEAVVKRPVVVGDAIAIRSMMNLSLSIDHRALDGLAAARFLQQVKGWLEAVDEGTAVY
ncbi:MAG: 2-oxo acid dehydrogenase subunit E2, partial [Chloroflexota bacterium]|nr:2-oxo acid dehydrogenase subunit E2 [Chloroflexota bacterium]